MKKVFSVSLLVLVSVSQSLLAHSSQVVHIHPHGENSFLTTWLVAAAIGLVLGGRYLLKRSSQK